MSKTIPTKRGCGTRMPGGLYLSLGTGDVGIPWWKCLVDPPTPFSGAKFQGIKVAEDAITAKVPDGHILLLDMVSAKEYTVATFVEEVRRFGLSRRIQAKFDFSQCQGKQVWLGLIHWQAVIEYGQESVKMPLAKFRFCEKGGENGNANPHFPLCIFHQWMQAPSQLAHRRVDGKPAVYTDSEGRVMVRMPSFEFDAMNVLVEKTLACRPSQFPEPAGYLPGLFAIFPISHVEAVGYVPKKTSVGEAGLPVVVMEE